jgi:hypothetical protein
MERVKHLGFRKSENKKLFRLKNIRQSKAEGGEIFSYLTLNEKWQYAQLRVAGC